jgi:hypothetical protein
MTIFIWFNNIMSFQAPKTTKKNQPIMPYNYLPATAVTIVGFVVLIITLQHIGRTHGWTWTPGYVIEQVAIFSEHCWALVGRFWALISSFYARIDLKELWITCDQIFGPLSRLFWSWTQAFIEYTSVAHTFVHPGLVGLGSATLIGLVACLIYFKYTWFAPVFDPVAKYVKSIAF